MLCRCQNLRVSSKKYTSIVAMVIQKAYSQQSVDGAGLSADQMKKIEITDRQLRSQYKRLDDLLPIDEKDYVRRKRMIYRSKQRGWLEADILMGSWAVENVPKLGAKDMDDYEDLLDEETIDIFNYITGKDPIPNHLRDKPVLKRLQEYAINTKLSEPSDYAALKKDCNLI